MADNIFGIGNAQFKGTGDPDTNTVTLYRYEYLERNFAEPQTYEGISPLSGFRNFGLVGDYSHFQMVVNIFKYTSGVEGDTTKSALEKFRTYHGKLVEFRPHKDGDWVGGTNGGQWMQDSAGNAVSYFLTVIPIALEGVPYSSEKIQVILDFKSVDFTDIVKIIDTEPA